jgi:outer membrane receptor protein involved in Fe transport
MKRAMTIAVLLILSSWVAHTARAGIDGSVSGTVTDPQGIAVSSAKVRVLTPEGALVKEITTSPTGDFQVFPLTFGDYKLSAEVPGFAPYEGMVHVASGGNTEVDIHLQAKGAEKEVVLQVKAKRRLVQASAATSSTEISQDQIKTLPQGNEISLPKLITTTNPGVVAGPFGQMFFRGNHADIQYQIDGIQLPDSPSNTFGDAFSPRNIDHMEIITGGIPAEYGERLASVVNIVTKSGPETPGGELELNYGTFNTVSPHILYGGSNAAGDIHYFLSANYSRTDRGLDTPQPTSESDQSQGGTDPIHDTAYGNSEFAKIDWLPDNEDKFSFILFNADNHYQIPNYPSNFLPGDPFFQKGFTDEYGNTNGPNATTFVWTPATTNDAQSEANVYAEAVWKHTLSERSFLQLAPYWKYSQIRVDNDPANDLASGLGGNPDFIAGATPSTFYENRHVNNVGLKGDYSTRPNDSNLVKAGFQVQWSRADGLISVQATNGTGALTPNSTDSSPDTGIFESVYVQDDFTIAKPLILNAGVRFDATQFRFADVSPTDDYVQPRIGLNYMATETTKFHVFYGKLFMPAPVENLRDTFVAVGGGNQLAPYDIKAEKDDYYEFGVAQQFAESQVVAVNVYYKNATNMLDDAQLLNTSIAQPYNYATGYAYGIELSIKGQIDSDWSDYLNYSYEIAKGKGISGGLFTGVPVNPGYQFLDHVQEHTANAGVSYTKDHFWGSAQGLFGSGLRTDPDNSASLPSHFSMDLTAGYEFHGDSWLSRFKVSGDILNVLNNVYPITIANGFNGSHYAAGREFFIHLTKEL